jgi:hypothetical protein
MGNERLADAIISSLRLFSGSAFKVYNDDPSLKDQESRNDLSSGVVLDVSHVVGIVRGDYIVFAFKKLNIFEPIPDFIKRVEENGGSVFVVSSLREVSAILVKIFAKDLNQSRRKLKLLP